MENNTYKASVDASLTWIADRMLTYNRASWGVYERIRTDLNERVALSRPDTASEYIKALFLYKRIFGCTKYDDIYENLIRWLQYAQNSTATEGNTGFPFSLVDGNKRYRTDKLLYQNDNGKIIINLLDVYSQTKDDRLRKMALSCADFWVSVQNDKGIFEDPTVADIQPHGNGACFVLWLMAAMNLCYKITGKNEYRQSGRAALDYILTIVRDGRLLTSQETAHTEDWRPVSSENYIAMLCLARSAECVDDPDYTKLLQTIMPFCRKLIDPITGAIRNCTPQTANGGEANDPDICDLVYTQGYALNALIAAHRITNDADLLLQAQKLANWLVAVQCRNESVPINGGWRGSYRLSKQCFAGKCCNDLAEGGADSVYVGWTALPIVCGLLALCRHELS